jgi:hypothetical protein
MSCNSKSSGVRSTARIELGAFTGSRGEENKKELATVRLGLSSFAQNVYTLPDTNTLFGENADKNSSSKRKIFIEKDIFGPTYAQRKRNIVTFEDGTVMSDTFRLQGFYYWTYDKKGNPVYAPSDPFILKFKILDYNYEIKKDFGNLVPLKNNFKFHPTGDSKLGGLDTQQWVLFKSTGKSEEEWKSHVETLFTKGKWFYDHSFSVDIPFLFNETAEQARKFYAEYEGEYNYFLKEQEESMKDSPELLLPNLYLESIVSEPTLSIINKNDYLGIVTFNGIPSLSEMAEKRQKNKKTEDTNKKYLKEKAKKMKEVEPQFIQKLNSRNDFWFSFLDGGELMPKYAKDKELFPMCVDLHFSSGGESKISKSLKLTGLGDSVIETLIQARNGRVSEQKKEFIEIEQIAQNDTLSVSSNFSNVSLRMWDVDSWLSSSGSAEQRKDNFGIPITKIDFEESFRISQKIGTLMREIFADEMKTLVKNNLRTFKNTLEGQFCYSNTVVYRIEKFASDENGNAIGGPIQEYYIPNFGGKELIEFVDSQVKYLKYYKYDIYAYQIVIGTKYRYQDALVNGLQAAVKVIQEPSILMIEVPYFSVNTCVVDDPPIEPDVSIVPYKGVNNRLLFMFNSGVGSKKEYPVVFGSAQMRSLASWYKSKSVVPGGKVTFASDDPVKMFQVFRTVAKPRKFEDFGENLLVVKTDILEETPLEANSAAFVDHLSPNVTYWYMFRSIDRHGHYSQPSDIWEVTFREMSAGGTWLETRTFRFEDENDRYDENKYVKGMRKYLHIVPNVLQTTINEEKSGLVGEESVANVENVILGRAAEGSLWGQAFKVRLTSKKTGRMIDLNLKFTFAGIKKETDG